MRNGHRPVFALVSVVTLVASVGCGRKQVVEAPEPATDHSAHSSPTPTAPPATKSLPTTTAANPSDDRQRATLEEMIHFGFDRSDLTPEARTTLTGKVDILRSAQAVTLRIEGHADERGSDEYNLALSSRRAAEAKRFLVQQGIDAGRLEVVGFGEEQPMATGHDEQAWAMNRRAAFRISGGMSR